MQLIILIILGILELMSAIKLTSPCEAALVVSEKQLNIEIDYFSRNFEMKHYKAALSIFNALKKLKKHPKFKIHTFELYDKAFRWPKIRRYELVQKHMDLIEHF